MVFISLWRTYLKFLDLHPLRSRMMTTATIIGIGDMLGQYINPPDDGFEPQRAVLMSLYGGLLISPITFKWFQFLHKIFPTRTLPSTLGKVAIDAAIGGPFFITTFLISRGLYAQLTPSQIGDSLQNNFLGLWKNSIKFWPSAQMLNFYLVPHALQMPFISVASLIWNTYLSVVATKTKHNQVSTPSEVAEGTLKEPSNSGQTLPQAK